MSTFTTRRTHPAPTTPDEAPMTPTSSASTGTDGATVDDLAADLAATAEPGSVVAMLLRLQFPVFSTFFKLTVLNHCLLLGLPQGRDAADRPTFRAA